MGTLLIPGRHRFARGLASLGARTPYRHDGSGRRARSPKTAGGLTILKRCIAAFACLHILAVPALADPTETPACRIELSTTWASMKEMVTRLKAVSRSNTDEKCAVYRTHVQVVLHARDVLSRCRSGHEREADLAQMDGALDDVNAALGRECAGTAGMTIIPLGPRSSE